MKTIYKSFVALFLLSCSVVTLQAQALRTGYFSDSYLYRHQMNPALANTASYFSVPVIGNTNVGFGSNYGIKSLIYEKKDGSGLTTFMNEEVSANAFLGNLEDINNIKFNLDMTLFSLGLKLGGGYYTLDINAHTRAKADIAKDLFRFMKETTSNSRYNLSDTRITSMAWTEIALGHSREVIDNLRVGMKLKVLLGIAYADADFADTYVDLSDETWKVNMNGNLAVAGGGKFKTRSNSTEMTGYEDFTPGVNGKGFAIDLGATFTLPILENIKISASLTDIGAIKWDCEQAAANDKQFSFEGFNETKIHAGEGTIDPETGNTGYYDGTLDEQWKRIEDDLEDLTKFDVQAPSKIRERIGATANLGVEFEVPLYRKLSFGALYSQRFSKNWGYVEARAVANYAPSKAFDLALSGSIGSNGAGFGVLANLHVPGFNLFVGFDQLYMGSFNSDMIPLESGNTSVAMGINIPLGF